MSAAASSGVPPRSPQGIPCPGGVGGRGPSYQGPRHLGVAPFLRVSIPGDVHAAGGIHNPPAPIRLVLCVGVPLRALGTWPCTGWWTSRSLSSVFGGVAQSKWGWPAAVLSQWMAWRHVRLLPLLSHRRSS